MLLKRLYDMPEGWVAEYNETGQLTNSPSLLGLRLIHTGVHPEQNFSRRLIDNLLLAGLADMSKGNIVIHTEQGDFVYKIMNYPGQYICCHDNKVIDGGSSRGDVQRAYVTQNFPGKPSPDPSNPSGYRLVNAYECVLDAEQHAQWKVPPNATVSFWRGDV